MREEDKRSVQTVAARHAVWILVRETNPSSLPFVGQSGFAPKPIHCKAKTADVGPLAGLVVDPRRCPSAFTPGRRSKAHEAWGGGPGAEFSCVDDASSPWNGCVTWRGDKLFGDYDLYDVVLAGQEHRNLGLVTQRHGRMNVVGARQVVIERELNQLLGVGMVRHGGDAQYFEPGRPATAAQQAERRASQERILVFAPDGGPPRTQTEAEVLAWYRTLGRQRLDGPRRAAQPLPGGPLPSNVVRFPRR